MANGWYGWEPDPERTAHSSTALHEAGDRYGRQAELGDLEITITPPAHFDLDTARRYADIGVHRLVPRPQASDGSAMDDLMKSIGDELIGRL